MNMRSIIAVVSLGAAVIATAQDSAQPIESMPRDEKPAVEEAAPARPPATTPPAGNHRVIDLRGSQHSHGTAATVVVAPPVEPPSISELLERVNNNDAEAMRLLAKRYLEGDNDAGELARARDLYKSAAALGDADSMFEYAYMCNNGIGGPIDDAAALTWYTEAATKSQHVLARYNLGYMYQNGRGVDEDHKTALEWYYRAAEGGHAKSMYAIGYLLIYGRGVEHSTRNALKWFERSVENGHVDAMNMVALMNLEGLGIPKDVKTGIAWVRRAAESGSPLGMRNLGLLYYSGEYMEPDRVQAKKWFTAAASAGDAEATAWLTRMEEAEKKAAATEAAPGPKPEPAGDRDAAATTPAG